MISKNVLKAFKHLDWLYPSTFPSDRLSPFDTSKEGAFWCWFVQIWCDRFSSFIGSFLNFPQEFRLAASFCWRNAHRQGAATARARYCCVSRRLSITSLSWIPRPICQNVCQPGKGTLLAKEDCKQRAMLTCVTCLHRCFSFRMCWRLWVRCASLIWSSNS